MLMDRNFFFYFLILGCQVGHVISSDIMGLSLMILPSMDGWMDGWTDDILHMYIRNRVEVYVQACIPSTDGLNNK